MVGCCWWSEAVVPGAEAEEAERWRPTGEFLLGLPAASLTEDKCAKTRGLCPIIFKNIFNRVAEDGEKVRGEDALLSRTGRLGQWVEVPSRRGGAGAPGRRTAATNKIGAPAVAGAPGGLMVVGYPARCHSCPIARPRSRSGKAPGADKRGWLSDRPGGARVAGTWIARGKARWPSWS